LPRPFFKFTVENKNDDLVTIVKQEPKRKKIKKTSKLPLNKTVFQYIFEDRFEEFRKFLQENIIDKNLNL